MKEGIFWGNKLTEKKESWGVGGIRSEKGN